MADSGGVRVGTYRKYGRCTKRRTATGSGICQEPGTWKCRIFGAENLTGQVNGGKEIKVTYTADTVSGFGGLKWKLAVDGSSRVVRPVEWIRKIRAASEVIAEIGG